MPWKSPVPLGVLEVPLWVWTRCTASEVAMADAVERRWNASLPKSMHANAVSLHRAAHYPDTNGAQCRNFLLRACV